MAAFASRLVVDLDDGIHGSVELGRGVEEGELDDEEVLEGLPAELGHKLPRGLGGSACTKPDQNLVRNTK